MRGEEKSKRKVEEEPDTLREVCFLFSSLQFWGITVALLDITIIQGYSNCWHFSSSECCSKSKKCSFLSECLCRLSFFSSLMRWNVAKLAAERQSFIYKTIKWSFTKHTQYALDVSFVNIGWPPYTLKWGGGVFGCCTVVKNAKLKSSITMQ